MKEYNNRKHSKIKKISVGDGLTKFLLIFLIKKREKKNYISMLKILINKTLNLKKLNYKM